MKPRYRREWLDGAQFHRRKPWAIRPPADLPELQCIEDQCRRIEARAAPTGQQGYFLKRFGMVLVTRWMVRLNGWGRWRRVYGLHNDGQAMLLVRHGYRTYRIRDAAILFAEP